MINITLKESNNDVSLNSKTITPIVIDEQLNTELDSGTISYLTTEPDSKELNEALARYSIGIEHIVDGNSQNEQFDFVGMDSRALLRKGTDGQSVYKHQVSLTEPSKLLQGVMIDGLGVTQPEDYNSRKTLKDVVERLFAVTPFDERRFWLTSDETVVNVLSEIIAPEFKWNTQTSLWECLLQVGAVIDAMPRLVADGSGNYTIVTFDFVNANGREATDISDTFTNVEGQSIDESLYNTALSSIVENLRENE